MPAARIGWQSDANFHRKVDLDDPTVPQSDMLIIY